MELEMWMQVIKKIMDERVVWMQLQMKPEGMRVMMVMIEEKGERGEQEKDKMMPEMIWMVIVVAKMEPKRQE